MTDNKQPLTVRVYGDSISMPRFADGIGVDRSWPTLLEDELRKSGLPYVHVLNRSLGGANIREIKALFDRDSVYFRGAHDVVIFRFGIVDCTPRPIPLWFRRLVSLNLLNLGTHIISYLHDHREGIIRKHYFQNTKIELFLRLYRQMLDGVKANGGTCICIGAGPVSDEMESKSPGIRREMSRYNAQLQTIMAEDACYVSPEQLFPDGAANYLLPDGHHNNAAGNALVARSVARIVLHHLLLASADCSK